MRATSWVCGAVVALAVLGTSACGVPTVSVVPTGGSGSSTCAEDGTGGSVCVGADGTTITDGQGGSVSAGQGGVTVSDGQGGSFTAGQGGVSVEDGQGGSFTAGQGGVSASGGPGVSGTTGTVTVSGAVTWRGNAGGSCDVTSTSARTITADLGAAGRLVIDTTSADMAEVTLTRGGATWTADYLDNARTVLTLVAGSTQLRSAQLAGDGGTVVVSATFSC